VKPNRLPRVVVVALSVLTEGASMSDLSTTARGGILPCPRCGTTMGEVVSIAPVLGQPGLIGYECPNCVYVASVLWEPDRPKSAASNHVR
jgi:hypothetical protein